MERFTKALVPEWRRATISFQGRGNLVELGHFDKNFVKNTSKKLHNYILNVCMGNLIQRWTHNHGLLFSKSDSFFRFSKKGSEGLPPSPPCCTHVSMDEYASIYLNIPKCSWNACMLFWLCPSALSMPGHLTCLTGFWRCLGFWMCQKSEYDTVVYARVYTEFWICLNIPQNMPEYALMSANMPDHGLILLSAP